MKNVAEVQQILVKLTAHQDEQRRLVKTLEYYAWMAERGIDFEKVAGCTNPIPLRDPLRPSILAGWTIVSKLKSWGRRTGRLDEVLKATAAISYRLVDGTEVLLPWPPYDDNVIFNEQVGCILE